MSKNISKIFVIFFSLNNFISINIYADSSSVFVVNNKNGINIRDKDCNIIDKAGYGETLYLYPRSLKSITCNINGQNLTFVNYLPVSVTAGFVAQSFISPILSSGNIDLSRITKDKNGLEYSKVYLNNTNNLNLRDKNCKISQNVSHEVALFIPPVGGGANAFICQVGNKFYDMRPVTKDTNGGSTVYFALR
jgi:hypothetical protein